MNEAVDIYPNHPDAQLVLAQLSSAVTEYEEVLRKGIDAIGRVQLHMAQISFERAWQLSPESPAVKWHIDVVNIMQQQIENTKADIDAAIEQGNRTKAMALASDLELYVEKIKGQVK